MQIVLFSVKLLGLLIISTQMYIIGHYLGTEPIKKQTIIMMGIGTICLTVPTILDVYAICNIPYEMTSVHTLLIVPFGWLVGYQLTQTKKI